jgi:hypothetical protein
MPFVLVSTSTGDGLIPSEKNFVMVSDDREALETERDRRAVERKEWLATHELPWWGDYAVIASEKVEEIPTLAGGTIAGNLSGQTDGGLSQRENL